MLRSGHQGVEEWNDRRKVGWSIPDLSGADLSLANLSGANLSGVNLSGSDLHEAGLSGADLRGANLRWANLYRTDLEDADLRSADLSAADLNLANLSKADFRLANLRGTDLRGTKLTHADFRGADLREASSLKIVPPRSFIAPFATPLWLRIRLFFRRFRWQRIADSGPCAAEHSEGPDPAPLELPSTKQNVELPAEDLAHAEFRRRNAGRWIAWTRGFGEPVATGGTWDEVRSEVSRSGHENVVFEWVPPDLGYMPVARM